MDDFVTDTQIKDLLRSACYINLSTIRDDGTPHPSNVRIVHGHSLSMYFLSEATSQKSLNISVDSRVCGSLLIDKPKPGTGFNLYFNGAAHRIAKNEEVPSVLPSHYAERANAIKALCAGRDDYAANMQDILDGKTNLMLHRILLTQAWYNGGIYKEGSNVESNATRDLKIVGDKTSPIVRRYLIDSQQATPEYATDLPKNHIQMVLAA